MYVPLQYTIKPKPGQGKKEGAAVPLLLVIFLFFDDVDISAANPLLLQSLVLVVDHGDGVVLLQHMSLAAGVHFQEPAGGQTLVHAQNTAGFHADQFLLAIFPNSFNKHCLFPTFFMMIFKNRCDFL